MVCHYCQKEVLRVTFRASDLDHGRCADCYYVGDSLPNLAPGVITDEIPGGLDIKHGICNEDGSPKRYYSKSEIRRAAFESGWTISGETPKPNQRLVEQRQASAETSRMKIRTRD